MTHLTYTIAHIKVGDNKPYEEVKGRVANDFQDIEVKYISHFLQIEIKRTLKQNRNHLFSELADKLGAIVYGGFKKEKDFYLMMPTIEGFKVGDYYFDSILSIYAFKKYKKHDEERARFGFHMLQLSIHTECEDFSSYEINFDDILGLNDVGKSFQPEMKEFFLYARISFFLEHPKKNIFQEYARTGIIENDLYKHFFNK